MGLTSKYVLSAKRLPEFFSKIRDGQAPRQLTQQLLKDWGFSSSTDRAVIPLMKDLGFLSPDGKPTTRYHEYRDHSRSKVVMAEAIREAYSDLFVIKEHPTDGDRSLIQGKFKSFHNVSDTVARAMAATFFSLLSLSDLTSTSTNGRTAGTVEQEGSPEATEQNDKVGIAKSRPVAYGLHYDIQIHLPATKDIEVYNAIFKSLREHLIEE